MFPIIRPSRSQTVIHKIMKLLKNTLTKQKCENVFALIVEEPKGAMISSIQQDTFNL